MMPTTVDATPNRVCRIGQQDFALNRETREGPYTEPGM
jgi:hypothetical protein